MNQQHTHTQCGKRTGISYEQSSKAFKIGSEGEGGAGEAIERGSREIETDGEREISFTFGYRERAGISYK